MCYSAQVIADWKRFLAASGARLSLRDFHELLERRQLDPVEFHLPRGFELQFANPQSAEERAIRSLVEQYRRGQTARLETDIFIQRKRVADAERKLALKTTKAATESRRIATNKVEQALDKLILLKDDRPHPDDYRIFPRSYAPIVLVRDGVKVMVPARYLLSGSYNARRDNLTGFWRQQFGVTHAVLAIESFYENVAREGRNEVLHFNPQPSGTMLIACLYAQWTVAKTGQELRSFAAITDEPPPEVAAAGHDRMIVNLKPRHVDRWLTPQGRSDAELQEILGDRQQPYYEHRIAA
jgi:putative SOS response-associated peptidase YedK